MKKKRSAKTQRTFDKRRAQRERVQTQGAREDVNSQPNDEGWGTSPGSMGRVKMQSEEAKLVSCPDCGYSGGRHSRTCPRA